MGGSGNDSTGMGGNENNKVSNFITNTKCTLHYNIIQETHQEMR